MRRFLPLLLLLALGATAGSGAPAPGTQPAGGTPPAEEFRPSTRVPADEAVSFPVDI